jgi:hypothetical protein
MISGSHTCDRIQAKELENLKAQWKFISFAEKLCWRYMEHSREASAVHSKNDQLNEFTQASLAPTLSLDSCSNQWGLTGRAHSLQ